MENKLAKSVVSASLLVGMIAVSVPSALAHRDGGSNSGPGSGDSHRSDDSHRFRDLDVRVVERVRVPVRKKVFQDRRRVVRDRVVKEVTKRVEVTKRIVRDRIVRERVRNVRNF